ncbi:serine-rich adhesin for platelets-like [Ranitomeya imitator]|uniref:serine-rich adhesin for platelets-like n=1 Tax=Ranitomeya imitator TaxID=111125 RepID=UPI0037E7B2E7
MLLVGILCLLSTLPPTTFSLNCTECRTINSTSCTGESVLCSQNYVCASFYSTTLNNDGTSSLELIRSCAPSSQCNVTGTIGLSSGKMRMFTSCCNDTDNCMSPNDTEPSFSSQPNGVICPSCQASDSDWCYSGSTLPCSGDENVCVLHATTTDGNKSSFRGCASKSLCGSQTYNVNGSNIAYDLTCTCGGPPSSTMCSDTNVTCAAGTVCATVHAVTTIGDASSERFTKTCSPINHCGISGIASIPNGNMKIMTVCSIDNCSLSFPEFPKEKTDLNGVTCQKCISADTDCYNSQTMKCTGDERACLLQTTQLTGRTKASLAVRGCTTWSICDLTRQDYTVDGITSATKFTCTNGAAVVWRDLVTAAVISLLTLKYLILIND